MDLLIIGLTDDGLTEGRCIFPSSLSPSHVFSRPAFITYCLLSLFFFSCQAPEEGCTDLAASNFDVTALKNCTNCCTYPVMKIQAQYNWGSDSVSFNFNTKYLIGQDTIQFLSAQFYISEIILTSAATGKQATVSDSISLYRATDTIMKPNYYGLIGKSNGFSYTFGHFTNFGQYSNITFKIGMDQEANKTIPKKMPSSSPFSIKADNNYDSLAITPSYIFHKIIFVKGVNFKDTVKINIETAKSFSTTCNLNFQSGFDATIPLKIDYQQLFKSVNVRDSIPMMINQIVSNSPYAFKVQ